MIEGVIFRDGRDVGRTKKLQNGGSKKLQNRGEKSYKIEICYLKREKYVTHNIM